MIKSFKAFGIELETEFSESINEVKIIGKIETIESPRLTKDSVTFLRDMGDRHRSKIQRLKFSLAKQDYYDSYAIKEYLRLLPRLKYIEIADDEGKFRYLMFSRLFKFRRIDNEMQFDEAIVEKFIKAIEYDKIEEYFPNSISIKLDASDSLISAYNKFESTNQGMYLKDQILPVVDESDLMIGIIKRSKLEKEIAQQVVNLVKEKR